MALRPFFVKRDDMEDIPLTPAQRKLLGLPPSSRPATPNSEYVTPPRYRRTSTPLSGSPSRKGSPATGSPSGKRTDSPYNAGGLESLANPSGSIYSPGASPLLQKAMMNGNGMRRSSYSSLSPLGGSTTDLPGTPGTPSPPTGKTTSVGLNNKWLYEKGRRNSGNARLYT
jgi:nucleoporin POM34